MLLAGASAIALTIGSQNVRAEKAPHPAATKPPAVVEPAWTWWIEGGAFAAAGRGLNTGPQILGQAFGLPALGSPPGVIPGFGGFGPIWGGEGAIGFDWKSPVLDAWHVSAQFRYGSANSSKPYAQAAPFFILNGTENANQDLRDEHWLLDFAVGREFGFGGSTAQWKVGVRVADLRATLTANGRFAGTFNLSGSILPTAANISGRQKTSFLGAGPRLAVEGETPLGGNWALDWLAGAAVLFGEDNLDQTYSAIPSPGGHFPGAAPFTTNVSSSGGAAVFNPDGQLGLSYAFNPRLKLTVSYRVDAYFNALRTFNASGNVTNANRVYSGPMVRLTSQF